MSVNRKLKKRILKALEPSYPNYVQVLEFLNQVDKGEGYNKINKVLYDLNGEGLIEASFTPAPGKARLTPAGRKHLSHSGILRSCWRKAAPFLSQIIIGVIILVIASIVLSYCGFAN